MSSRTQSGPITRTDRHIVVIGGGVLGSSAAAAIAASGVGVTLVTDEIRSTTEASTASLAWVNAIDDTSAAYAAFKSDGRAAHTRRGIGAGWFVHTGSNRDGADAADDGYLDVERFIAAHRAALLAAGGAVRTGLRVRGLRRRGAQICVETEDSADARPPAIADSVVIAAGTGTADLAHSIGADTRRLGTATGPRGFLARIRIDHTISRVESYGGLQLRPDGDGVLAAQSLPIEQALRERGERATATSVWPALRAEVAAVLGREVPEDALVRIDEASRPMSSDGLPVVGWIADGVYALLAHSGVTLATLLGELVGRDLSGDADERLAPYRP